jgi:hypothetical protein
MPGANPGLCSFISWEHEVLANSCYLQNRVLPVGYIGVLELDGTLDLELTINIKMNVISRYTDVGLLWDFCGCQIFTNKYMTHKYLCANTYNYKE